MAHNPVKLQMINRKKILFIIIVLLNMLVLRYKISFAAEEKPPAVNELISKITYMYYQGDTGEALYLLGQEKEQLNRNQLLELAMLYAKNHDFFNANIIYNRILVNFPDDHKAMSGLSKCYLFNADIKKAEQLLQKITDLYPEDIEAIYYLGWCSEENKKYEKALSYYNQVLGRQAGYLPSLWRAAGIYEKLNDYSNAENYYLKIKAIDSSWTIILPRLAVIYEKQENWQKYFQIISKLTAVEPENKLWLAKLEQARKNLGRDYFAKLEERRSKEREATYTVTPVFGENIPIIGVSITQDKFSVNFKCSSGFQVIGQKDNKIFNLPDTKNRQFTLKPKNNRLCLFDERDKLLLDFEQDIMITPLEATSTIAIFDIKFGEGTFWAQTMDRNYRGQIKVALKNNKISVINRLNLEEYLYGVLPAEMISSSPVEALKAQAVLARTMAVYRKKHTPHKNDGFDFCSNVHCQSYRGVSAETEATNKAVDLTRGQIVLYNSSPIEAIYSNNCGGHTQNNIFGVKTNIPYLQGRVDASGISEFGDLLSPLALDDWLTNAPKDILCNREQADTANFRWEKIYSQEELSKVINKYYPIGSIKDIKLLGREKSLHLAKILLIGTKGRQEIAGELNIRKVLGGLRSSMFDYWLKFDAQKKPQFFIFYGGGWGHGVGLCQSGALTLAEKGYNSDFILRFYFRDIEVKKTY